MTCLSAEAQRTLDFFIHQATANSPLIVANRGQKAIDAAEMDRLKAAYTHSRLELTGDLLVVPVITTDNGSTRFKIDAQSADSYHGYDLGQSSSHLNAGLNWVQPLTGAKGLHAEQERLKVDQAIADNSINLTEHELNRQITEQFLLCQLDQENERSCIAIDSILTLQKKIVSRLADHGLTSPADTRLIEIEQQSNNNIRQVSIQSYLTHRAELNTICGITDMEALTPTHVTETPQATIRSAFMEQYRLDSLRAARDYDCYRDQYRPQLSFFASGGSQTGTFSDFYKRWGLSAGMHLSWTLADGKQMQGRHRQMAIRQEMADRQRQHAETVRKMRMEEMKARIASQDQQISNAAHQIESYRGLLQDYQKEMAAGRRSVIDYVNVFHNYRLQISQLNELKINRELLANTYNYWNW